MDWYITFKTKDGLNAVEKRRMGYLPNSIERRVQEPPRAPFAKDNPETASHTTVETRRYVLNDASPFARHATYREL